jgi:hypothetical protein
MAIACFERLISALTKVEAIRVPGNLVHIMALRAGA